MSRSYKKPILWACVTRAGQMKDWKRQCNHRVRREDDLGDGRYYKKLNNPWASPADGKVKLDDPKYTRK